MGRKKAPIYKIVAADSRSKRDGRFIEAVGQYDPSFNPAKVDIVETRVLYWLKSGAQPTVTVKNLFSSKGLMLKYHLLKKGADENKINAELVTWGLKQESKLQKANEKKLKRKEKKKKEAEKPAEAKAEVKAESPAEKPAEQPVEKTADVPVEQPVEKPVEQPVEKVSEQPAAEEKSAAEEKPAE